MAEVAETRSPGKERSAGSNRPRAVRRPAAVKCGQATVRGKRIVNTVPAEIDDSTEIVPP